MKFSVNRSGIRLRHTGDANHAVFAATDTDDIQRMRNAY
jgi:hypothetical protein